MVWTGIATVLLHGGRRSHSTFKVPVSEDDHLRCIVNNKVRMAITFAPLMFSF